MNVLRTSSMLRSALRLVAAWVVFIGFASVHAALPPESLVAGKRWALIIALDRYQNGPQRGARSAQEDGRHLAELLRTQYGYVGERVIELYDEAAASKDIFRLQSDVRERISSGDSVLIVVSARFEAGGSSGILFVPYDGFSAGPLSMIPLTELQSMFASAGSVLTVIERCPDSEALSKAVTQNVLLGSYGRRGSELVAGCNPDARDQRTFLQQWTTFLAGWHPSSPGRSLGANEWVLLLQKQQPFLQIQRIGDARQSSFAFQRQLPSLDPVFEARIRNRSADKEARLAVLAELASAVALDPTAAPRRGAIDALLMQLAADEVDHPDVRAAAIGYLGRLKVTDAQALLQRLLLSEDERDVVRLPALEALIEIAGGPDAQILAAAMRSPDHEIAQAAIQAAIRLPAEQAQSLLLGWIAPERPSAALVDALRALQLIGAPAEATVPPVLSIVQSKVGSRARREAIRLLGSFGAAQALDPLASIALQPEESPVIRQDAAYAIGKLTIDSDERRVAAAKTLHQVSTDSDANVRRAAVDSIGRLKDPDSRELLERLLEKDSSADVKEAAALALGQLGDPAASRALTRALRASDSKVRRAAAISLGEVGTTEDIEPLHALAKESKNEEVRKAAEQALGRLRSAPSDVGLWADVIQRSGDPEERARAIRQLPANVPTAEEARVTAILIEGLRDNDENVRAAAIAKLAMLPGTEAVRQLGIAIADRNDALSVSAALALGEIGRVARGTQRWSSALTVLVSQPPGRNSDVAVAVVRSIGFYPDERALDALAGYENSNERKIVIAAANAYRALGEQFYQQGAHASAIAAGERALELRLSLLGDADVEVATELNNLGAYVAANRDFVRAQYMLQRALAMREAAFAVKHPASGSERRREELEGAVILMNLASVYEAQGDHPSAENTYLRALNIRRSVLPESHVLVRQTMEKLVALYRAMGDEKRAESYVQAQIRALSPQQQRKY